MTVPLAAGAFAAGIAACASTGFHSHLEEQRYERAIQAFEADSALHDREDALYRAGLLYASPGTGTWDPARAVAALDRLLRLHADTDHRPAAERILALLDRLDSLDRTVAELDEQLRGLKAVDLEEPPSDTAGPKPR